MFQVFWGHILDSFWLMAVVQGTSGHACDSKVSKACLTILSNQNIALDIPSVSMWDHSLLCSPTGETAPCKRNNP
jgi:hypothetical protein